MTTQGQYFRLNEPDVTFEAFDAEVLAINLRNGNYYSLRETAIPIWLLTVRGLSIEEIGKKLSHSCQEDQATVTLSVGDFIQKLATEALLVALDSPPTIESEEPEVSLPTSFIDPILDSYTDMQQLLLMDPIHEVDTTGWPQAPAQKQG